MDEIEDLLDFFGFDGVLDHFDLFQITDFLDSLDVDLFA